MLFAVQNFALAKVANNLLILCTAGSKTMTRVRGRLYALGQELSFKGGVRRVPVVIHPFVTHVIHMNRNYIIALISLYSN
jgi:hypothetical protein